MVAERLPSAPPDNSPEAALARGELVRRQLAAQGIPAETLDEELCAEDTAAALAWLRGEGPCPSNV